MRRLYYTAGIAAVNLVAFSTACGDAPADRWAGTIDTLASGAVVVNNPAQGLWTVSERWTVEEELVIGSAMSERPNLFASLTGRVVTAMALYTCWTARRSS